MTVAVAAAELPIVNSDALRLVQCDAGIVAHFFSGTCGGYTHHRRADGPSLFGVNVGGLVGENPAETDPVPWLDGVNFQPGETETREWG
ncbi:MAG: hypothetical protein AB8B58_19695 [Roseobacter sp.]